MGIKKSRQYTLEFKRQAVQLAEELKSGTQAAAQLGIPKASLHTWCTQAKAGTLGGITSGEVVKRPQPQPSFEEENRRLQRELTTLKKVNYILKQAAAFFSQDQLK